MRNKATQDIMKKWKGEQAREEARQETREEARKEPASPEKKESEAQWVRFNVDVEKGRHRFADYR